MSDGMVKRDEATLAPGAEPTRPAPVFSRWWTSTTETRDGASGRPAGGDPGGAPIRLEDDILTLEAEMGDAFGASEAPLLQEYRTGRYYRQFSLGEAVDRDKIAATLKNGELRLVLPKAASARPQRIAIQAA